MKKNKNQQLQDPSFTILLKGDVCDLFLDNKKENEYSLKENFFDPSKSSPPNEFMKKLQLRMNIYNYFSFIKEDNRDIE